MTKRIAGKKSQAYGAQFERLIEISCRQYAIKNIAYIQKTPEPFRMIRKGRNGQVVGFYEKQAQPDFQGTLKNGQSIVFEAKHTSTSNIQFDRLSKQQELELSKHDKLGAMSFVLITFSLKDYYAVPWKDWKQLKESINKKSVNQDDLADYKVKQNKGLINFLNV